MVWNRCSLRTERSTFNNHMTALARLQTRHVQLPPLAYIASIPRPLPLTLKSPLVPPTSSAADAMRVTHPHRLELSRQRHTRRPASRALAPDHILPESHLMDCGTPFVRFLVSPLSQSSLFYLAHRTRDDPVAS